MILIWRGYGLLALAALFPLLASCAGLFDVEPKWMFVVAMVLTLTAGGVVCVLYGTHWNRHGVQHTFYFLPVETWGWVYLTLVALIALTTFVIGAASRWKTPKDFGMTLGGAATLILIAGVGQALRRSVRRTRLPKV